MRTAIITGGSSGIGKAIVTRLAEEGYQVMAASRNSDSLNHLKQSLSTKGLTILTATVNLQSEESIKTFIDYTATHFSALNVLVNCAGVGYDEPLSTGSTNLWREMIDTNILGLCICTREVLRYMENHNEYKHVINICSLSGHRVGPDGGLYSATKFAVTAITESLRRELLNKSSGVKVSQISPGLVRTNFHTTFYDNQDTSNNLYEQFTPLAPENIAEAVCYLLSQPKHANVNDIIIRPSEQSL